MSKIGKLLNEISINGNLVAQASKANSEADALDREIKNLKANLANTPANGPKIADLEKQRDAKRQEYAKMRKQMFG